MSDCSDLLQNLFPCTSAWGNWWISTKIFIDYRELCYTSPNLDPSRHFPRSVCKWADESQKVKNHDFGLFDRLRVLRLCSYFTGIEYSWVIQVLRVWSDSDDSEYHFSDFYSRISTDSSKHLLMLKGMIFEQISISMTSSEWSVGPQTLCTCSTQEYYRLRAFQMNKLPTLPKSQPNSESKWWKWWFSSKF